MARILLVESDPKSRMLMHRALIEGGHDVAVAHDVSGALWALRAAGPFDLVLAEMDMPGESGIELALKVAESHPETPVLLMAGHNSSHAG
jgi:DNA-binding NtrC family response regulator